MLVAVRKGRIHRGEKWRGKPSGQEQKCSKAEKEVPGAKTHSGTKPAAQKSTIRYSCFVAKRTRITLTKSESDSATGKQLLNQIFAMCHDGQLDLIEVEELHIFLRRDTSTIAAIAFLRAITREIVADGAIDDSEAYRLKRAFERVVPKDVRGIVATHLEDIGLPANDEEEAAPAWTHHEATAKQIEYIRNLGGTVLPKMTKGQASRLIDELLERRPATPRQVMLLRFFGRTDVAQSSKDEAGEWIDIFYASDERHERAWERFKRETNHDPFELDPSVVPIGACKDYLLEARTDDGAYASKDIRKVANKNRGKNSKGCLPSLLFAGLILFAGVVFLLR